MKTVCALLIAFVSIQVACAENAFPLAPVSFEITASRIEDKFNDVVMDPESFLKNYRPEGAVISRKTVSHGSIRFYATKTVLFVTQTVMINGAIDVEQTKSRCPKSTLGYSAVMDFAGSDDLITDNFDRMELSICASVKGDNLLMATVNGRLIKGNHFNPVIGEITKEVIAAQVNPLIKAIKVTIAKK